MTFIGNNAVFRHLRMEVTPDPERLEPPSNGLNERGPGPLRWLSHEIVSTSYYGSVSNVHKRVDQLVVHFKALIDQKPGFLPAELATSIAFSGAVGIGIFQTSSEIIALGGPVGALLAFIFAGLVIFSVMRCLAEMVSVRPVTVWHQRGD
ncbi:MAG: hypothetical protein Q9181_000862 [Wetmoreana brouardii]